MASGISMEYILKVLLELGFKWNYCSDIKFSTLVAATVSTLLLTSNSSINFAIYALMSHDFRQLLTKNIKAFCYKNSEEKEFGYDFGTHKIFIECDEKQHKSYCEKGEFNRMINIYGNEGGLSILFIRYNPDNYRENGVLNKKITQKDRETVLIKWLKHYENFDLHI